MGFLETPEMERLKDIGMNCGCEYTSFPRFSHLLPYSRHDHSMGAALIVWHFTKDRKQSIAALLHDIASPVFAHVVDFLKGDHMKQEATEEGTREIIEKSTQLQSLLKKERLTTEDVCDYHLYPIADNDSPKLSADRLEYTFGNMINFGFLKEDDLKKMYDDLIIGINEENEEELMFQNIEVAELFGYQALNCSKIYVADEDRYSMEVLADLLGYALQEKIIEEKDLHSTETEVIEKLRNNERTAAFWNEFCSLKKMYRFEERDEEGIRKKIFAKKRCIDPYVKDRGRLSEMLPDFRKRLDDFIHESQDCWIIGTE